MIQVKSVRTLIRVMVYKKGNVLRRNRKLQKRRKSGFKFGIKVFEKRIIRLIKEF